MAHRPRTSPRLQRPRTCASAAKRVVLSLTVVLAETSVLRARRVPDTLERLSRNRVAAPALARVIEARLPQASILVFVMSWPVTKDRSVDVSLDLPNGPAILTHGPGKVAECPDWMVLR